MCAVSVLIDHQIKKWIDLPPSPLVTLVPYPFSPNPLPWSEPLVTQKEADDFVELVQKMKKYDEETGQKDCEMEEKKRKLLELAKQLGVEITFPDENTELENEIQGDNIASCGD